MNIDASQRFIFGLEGSPEPLGSFKLDNIFVPTMGSPSFTNFEMRNEALSGYRWIHGTASDETYGSFKLQRFLEGSPTGIDIISFNDDGSFVFPGTTDAKYILQTANANLPNAQSLGALTTGILKNTVTAGTGVLSSTTAGVDYYAPNFPTTLVESFTDNVNPLLAYGNLGVGTEVLNSLTLNSPSDTLNLGVGIRALSSLTTGAGNTGLGMFCLLKLETGNYNTAVGAALTSLEDGEYNTAVGTLSGNALINGSKNCFFGSSDDPGVATLNECTFIGHAAGTSVDETEDSISVGSSAIVNGSEAIAIGRQAQAATTSIAIGRHAWSQAGNSIVIGNQAQNLNDNSIVIGFESATNGSNSVAIGHHAEAIGQDSIAIGYESNANDTGGDEGIAIGTNACARGTNSIALGKDVIVTADNSIGLGDGCNVGIGTFSPAYRLDVVGTGGIAINVNSNRIIGVADPVNPQDAVTKSFLEGFVGDVSEAKFIIQTADADLPNAQVLGSLSTGIVKNTTTTGVLSITTPGVDYYAPNFPTLIKDDAGTGGQNMSVGKHALEDVTTASSNTAFGSFVLRDLSTGVYNTAFGGTLCFPVLVSGNNNTGLGGDVFEHLTSGNNNIGIGVGVADDFTTTSDTISIGVASLENVTGGTRTIALGSAAGQWSGGGSGSFTECIFLGYSANASVSGLTNATAIGPFSVVSASNSIVLGNQTLYSTNVGMGTNSPTQARCVISGGVANVASEDSSLRVTGTSNATKIELERTTGSGKLYEIRSDNAGAFSIFDRTGAASRLFINSSGNIGLQGVTSPNAPLQFSTATANRKLVIYEAANNDHQFKGFGHNTDIFRFQINQTADSYVFYAAANSTTSNELMRLSGTGNLSVGSATVNLARLYLVGGVQNVANEDTIIRASSSANVAKIELQCTNGSGKNFEFRSNNAGAFSIVDRTAATTRFFINTSGQIGIGMTSPNAPLQLSSVVTNRQLVLYEAANNDYQFHGFGSISGGLGYNINEVGDSHVFFAGVNSSSRNELARIQGNGIVSIGVTSNQTTARLYVNGGVQNVTNEDTCIRAVSSSLSTKIELNNTTVSTGKLFELRSSSTGNFDITDRTAAATRITILSGGNVGIATNAPDNTLSVSGTANKTGGGTWGSFSDSRIKDILGDYTHGLNEILKITPKIYKYKENSGETAEEQEKERVGIIAQDIEYILPECIEKRETKGFQDLLYYDSSAILYVLLNAVKELNSKIEAMKG